MSEPTYLESDGIWCRMHRSADASSATGRPALFLDRDGVVVEEVHFLEGHVGQLLVAPTLFERALRQVTAGKLDFGTWERIFYGEFDGRRRKRVLVKIIGE